jgi:hypothetical protein
VVALAPDSRALLTNVNSPSTAGQRLVFAPFVHCGRLTNIIAFASDISQRIDTWRYQVTRLLRGRRRKMALIVAVPSAAIMVVFGALPGAWAVNWTTQAHCSDRNTCYYKHADFAPNGSANQVLNINGDVRNWKNIDDPIIQCHLPFTTDSGNWNDCASSYWSRRNTVTEYAWTDVFCTGSRLVISPGEKKAMNDTFNDKVSSDRDNNGNSDC